MAKVIITVAPTGSFLTKKEHPNVPLTPEEIAQAAYECWNEGAAIVHVHARDENAGNTGKAEVYQRIDELHTKRFGLSKIDIFGETDTFIGND